MLYRALFEIFTFKYFVFTGQNTSTAAGDRLNAALSNLTLTIIAQLIAPRYLFLMLSWITYTHSFILRPFGVL